jgi:phosphatidylserine/phosphatidylglycerophosphate/cardiolipin synthase-like enzyme
MHAKFAVVDRRVSLVGSYNLDPRSERLNSETAIVFEDAPLSAELARSVVERDLRYARRVTPADADRYESPPGIVERFRRRLGTAFENEL